MDGTSSDSEVLLTRSQIRAWLVEREEVARRLADLNRRLGPAEALLGTTMWASLLEDAGVAAQPSPDPFCFASEVSDQPEPRLIFSPSWLPDLVATQPLTEAELRAALDLEIERRNALPFSGSFRKIVENTARRGKLRKRGGFFYSAQLWDRIERGEIPDREGAEPRGDMRAAVLKALGELQAASAKEVVARLWTYEDIVPKLKRNVQYPYNILSRLALEGDLSREEGIYRFPDQEGSAA